MNTKLLVEKLAKFGSRFVVVHKKFGNDNAYDTLVRDVCVELDAQNFDYAVRHQDLYQDTDHSHYDFKYDVVLLLHTSIKHKEDTFPKTVLVVGNSQHAEQCDSVDKWFWAGEDFANIGVKNKSMMNMFENAAGSPASWETAIKISFTKFMPYVEQRILCPVYAGPIQEHAIDKLPTTEIVDHIKEKLYEGYQLIAFDDKDEAIFWNRIYKVHSVIERLGNIVPPGSFFFLTSALNAVEIYEKWCKKYNTEQLLVMIPCARFESVAKAMMLDEGILHHKKELDLPISTDPRPKKFLCYNRMPRLHRLKVLTELVKRDLHTQGLISFYNEDENLSTSRWRNVYTEVGTDCHWTDTMKFFYANVFTNLDQFQLNKTEERWNPVDIKSDDMDHFKDTYFSVVNETLFYKDDYKYSNLVDISPTDSVFLSEKIFKPLACKHPFVVVGVNGTLAHLKKYGYKTFDGWIDESYDDEYNDDKRMEMCIAEIDRLTRLSDNEWCTMIEEMIPTLQHNFDTLCKNKNLIVRNLNFIELFRNNKPY